MAVQKMRHVPCAKDSSAPMQRCRAAQKGRWAGTSHTGQVLQPSRQGLQAPNPPYSPTRRGPASHSCGWLCERPGAVLGRLRLLEVPAPAPGDLPRLPKNLSAGCPRSSGRAAASLPQLTPYPRFHVRSAPVASSRAAPPPPAPRSSLTTNSRNPHTHSTVPRHDGPDARSSRQE